MAEVRAEAEVRLWGTTVGALVELDTGRVLFEYADEFRALGLEISPIHLPTGLHGPQSFEELRRKEAFQGLPGVLADSLPDAFGRSVIRAYYAARGEAARAMSPIQRLLYVGERAIGALTFHPAEGPPIRDAGREALDIQALAHDAKRIVLGKPDVAVPEIYRIGSSAGGRRPKAVVHFDAERGTIRSGSVAPRSGEVPCILKFDGVGGVDRDGEIGPPQHYNRVEAAYASMAGAAEVEMARVHTLEIDGYAHLLVRRFDLDDGDRLHQHSLGGLIHVDYNEPGASSYEEYLRTILRLGMAYDALRQAFHRIVFNVMAVNQDDHVKNLSFQMDRTGSWSLAPAYDLTFAHGEGWTANHQMRIRDKVSGIRESDLLDVAVEFGVKRPRDILERTRGAIERWEEFAEERRVPDRAVSAVRDELDARAGELAGSA
ncbi:MAG: type II toxin-antitoxin system HipA family toxin [Gemmatimonadota bacterium]